MTISYYMQGVKAQRYEHQGYLDCPYELTSVEAKEWQAGWIASYERPLLESL